MTKFVLSAFADESDPAFAGQIAALKRNRIGLIELRGVNGKSCADLSNAEAREVKMTCDGEGIGFSALGSPYGKYPIDAPFGRHLDRFKRGLALCGMLGISRMRMFSFFLPEAGGDWTEDVLLRLDKMCALAKDAGVTLCHENEKAIYGEKAEACLRLLEAFGGALKAVYDPANFAQVGVTGEVFGAFLPYLSYLHIKDALVDGGAVVPAGLGDGCVAEILRRTAEARPETVLTLEPHLTVFSTLSALQKEALTHKYHYPSAEAAFDAAADALKEQMTGLGFEESKGETGVWIR